jgi:ditrans,polycis-polyprenyl diphosphate synthase
VKVVTIYAFSIENFKRSKFEVDALMEMARVKLSQMAQHGEILDRYGAKVRVLGRLDLLRPDVLKAVNRAQEMTSNNGDRVLNICFPYTSRDEITGAVRDTVADYSQPLRPRSSSLRTPFSETHIALNIQAQNQNGKSEDTGSDIESTSESAHGDEGGAKQHLPNRVYESDSSFSSSTTLDHAGQQDIMNAKREAQGNGTEAENPTFRSPETITRQTLSDHLHTKDNPPLDLLIRTSGVERLSDFMLWQCDEDTEIVFLDVLWPEFDLWQFIPVLLRWQRRISKSRKNPDAEGNFDGDVAGSSETDLSDQTLSPGGKIKGL